MEAAIYSSYPINEFTLINLDLLGQVYNLFSLEVIVACAKERSTCHHDYLREMTFSKLQDNLSNQNGPVDNKSTNC